MNFRNILMVSAGIACVFGVGFLLMPQPLAAIAGLTLNPEATFMARFLGGAAIGNGVLAWFARNIKHTDTQKAILLAFFITDGTGFLVALFGQLAGLMTGVGWSVVGMLLFLASGYGYLWFAATK